MKLALIALALVAACEAALLPNNIPILVRGEPVQVASSSVQSVDGCTEGPTYWCHSLPAAKQCDAVQHCIDTVWTHSESLNQEDGGEMCQFCEVVVQQARDALNNETEAQIVQVMDAVCAMLPDQSLASDCKTLVDQNIPEIFQMLRSAMDPETICSLIGFCQSEFGSPVGSAPVSVMQPRHTATGDVCADCKAFIGDLESMLTNATTEKMVEDYVKEMICASLGELEQECDELVESYVPELMSILIEEVDPDMVCQEFGVCSQKIKNLLFVKMRLQKTPLFKKARQMAGSTECDVCHTVLAELQTLDQDQTVQSEIEELIKSEVCSRLGDYEQSCDETVEQYGTILFELLANELDPDTRCRSLGFCVSTEDILRAATPAKIEVPAPEPVKISTQCVLCEFVMKELDGILAQNSTEQEIMAALDKVCSLLPDTISQQCTAFVDEYGPAVITLLEQELSPQEVCTALGLCDQKATKPAVIFSATRVHPVQSNESCGVCETVIQYAKSLLEQNSTMQQIEAALDKVCNFLPSDISAECKNFIDTYGPAVLNLLLVELTPEMICTEIGLCEEKHLPMMKLIQPAQSRLVGINPCTQGPSYWCSTEAAAAECNMTKHCMANVWNQN